MKKQRNRIVVITGASSGFGKGTALKFAESGANVVLAARRKRLLRDLAQQCREMGVQALAVAADVSESADVEELASRTIKEFGHIDVWINNAGVGTITRFDEAPMEEHEQVIRTNLLGTMYGAYAALQQFRKQGEGVLINIGSFSGSVAPPYMSSYAASKFGVRGFGMALRQELQQNGEDNIHVSTVMPVSMDTPFFEHAANHTGKPARPLGTVYDPQEVIDVFFELADNPQDEVVVGRSGKFAHAAHRLAPRMIERQMGKRTHSSQIEQPDSAAESSGSVFKPMKSGKEVRGGWLAPGESAKSAEDKKLPYRTGSNVGAVLKFAIPIGMSLAYMALQRARSRSMQQVA